jgi:hypothetical protein
MGYLITVDSYYGQLSTVKRLLELDHHFILSCKANKPFKSCTLLHLGKEKGASAWTTYKGKMIAFLWHDRKALNMLTNYYEWLVASAEWKNGRPILNIICGYHSTLGFVDQANAYHLHYCFLHQMFKHTCTQFQTIFFITIVNSWILHSHINERKILYCDFLCELTEALAAASGNQQTQDHQQKLTAPDSHQGGVHIPILAKKWGTCVVCTATSSKDCGLCTHICSGCSTATHPIYLHHSQKDCFTQHHGVDLCHFASLREK